MGPGRQDQALEQKEAKKEKHTEKFFEKILAKTSPNLQQETNIPRTGSTEFQRL